MAQRNKLKIGLALGGGGVRGLAHISVLEALDELGIKPSIVAGSSMGAMVGAIYASGIPGKRIRERFENHLILKDDTWRDVIEKRSDLLKWVTAFSADFSRGGLIKTERFFKYLFSEIKKNSFEELEIPLLVIATDYWKSEEVVFDSGPLLPAIQASIAVPGVFAPVSIGEKVLVDGSVVNLVPYDHLLDRADITIAVNVIGTRSRSDQVPNAIESVLGTFDILQTAVLAEKMRHRKPDVYVYPDISDVRLFEFNKIADVFRQAAPAVETMKMQLTQLMGKRSKKR